MSTMALKEIGDYNLIKRIGQGPLGTVFLAEHRFMRRQYVLKILPEELVKDRGFIHRFQEEVGKLSTLDHPGIVRIHNISYCQGRYFLVTDCIVDSLGETQNLAQFLREQKEPLEEKILISLAEQVGEALDYAHGKLGRETGMYHGGLKLNNILVGPSREQLTVCISDYGLTPIVGVGTVLTRTMMMVAEAYGLQDTLDCGESNEEASSATVVGSLTPLHYSFLQNYHFFSPEQKEIERRLELDYRTDIYAFGVLMYRMITGRYPQGCYTRVSNYLSGEGERWDAFVDACLSDRPECRPQSAMEALSLLEKEKREKIEVKGAAFSQEAKQVSLEGETSSRVNLKETNAGAQPVEEEGGVAVLQAIERTAREGSSKETLELLQSLLKKTQGEFVPVGTEEEGLQPKLEPGELERPSYDPDPLRSLHVDASVKEYHPEPRYREDVEPIPTDMVIIRGGEAVRGSTDGNRDEMPRHRVYLDSFALDVHPVTNEQYVQFLLAMGDVKDHNNHDMIRLKDSRLRRRGGEWSIESGYSKHPVVGITWYGAVAYAKWVGKRLPTEAEWEIAARGESGQSPYPTGDGIEKSQANFFSSDTTAVSSYPPNDYGLYDMAGNVYEWCQDWYGYNYYETSAAEPENPKGPLQGVYRVMRGGCWKSLKEDLRCGHRHRNNPGSTNGTYGFRCATDVC